MSEHSAAPDRIDPLHPCHDAGRLNRAHTAIVAEWPAGTFLENLARDPAGQSWLVTSPSDRAVYRVSPGGSVSVAAQFDRTPTGIVAHPALGTITAVGTQGEPDWQLRLLVVDSGRSVVVAVDVAAGTADPWLQHPLLTPVDTKSPLPGVNMASTSTPAG